MSIDNPDTVFQVVVNDEDQYSIWFADRDVPAGWTADGTRGTKKECLDHIEKVWTDMRPRSVRARMTA
ncbi:MbtH family protein [Actinocrispum wychmicini]|uniref:MbtH protein n=1 Tax=Actinocrispum wychmicini TaxID=1213861 RepID=A0A4R2JDC9_9PSEU|nr:MbtH family NRPS accessory protein [Actinocrispum wychmicini]TCO56102.1 MbtH protein [Actinocrispum wychmicini]